MALTELATLYAHIKGLNAIYKSGDIGQSLLGKLVQSYKDDKASERLEFILQHLEEVDDIVKPDKDVKYPKHVVAVITYLPTSLFLNYTQSPQFSSIRIPSDFENRIGELNMNNYFVSLSYKERIHQEEDLASLMKKEQSLKYWAPSNHTVDDKFNSAEYLSTQILNHHKRLLVHGNAGIGKSTYARWMCNQWAQSRLNIKTLPIYIELKKLDFAQNKPIVNYIAKQYLRGFSEDLIQDTIELLSTNFRFIFDGIDELNQSEKSSFTNSLSKLTLDPKNVKYLILGRPYGFLNHMFNYNEGAISIDGFSSSSVFRYVYRLNEKLENNSSDKLLEIIKENLILKEYSHNPLILSYIIMIYNFRGQGDKILAGIQSMYSLHKEVYEWILQYGHRVKGQSLPSEIWLKAIFKFSSDLILDKKFVFKKNGNVLEEQEMLSTASSLGFGSLVQEDDGLSHIFSFSSVTIQEYFAAEGLLDNINANALSYLTNSSFFWNLIKLIVGGLSYHQKEEIVIETFQRLKGNEEWFDIYSNRVLYYSVLSESSTIVINNFINEQELNALLDLTEEVYFDSDWYSILLNAIRRLVAKLNLKNRTIYRDCIISRTKSLLEVDRLDNEGVQRTYLIMELGIHTFLVNDENFINTIVDTLHALNEEYLKLDGSQEDVGEGASKKVKVLKHPVTDPHDDSGINDNFFIKPCITCKGSGKLNQVRSTFLGKIRTLTLCSSCNGSGQIDVSILETCNNENREYTDDTAIDWSNNLTAFEQSIDTAMFTLIRILEHTDVNNILSKKEMINELFQSCSYLLKQDFAFVSARGESYENLSSQMKNLLPDLLKVNLDDFSGLVFPEIVVEFTASIFKLCYLHPKIETEEIYRIIEGLGHYISILEQEPNADFHRALFKACSEMLIAGLEKCQNHNFINHTYAIHTTTETEEYVYMENKDFYDSSLLELQKRIANNITGEDIIKYSWLLRYTVYGINSFYSHLDTCRTIVDYWCNTYHEEFSKEDSTEVDEEIAFPLLSILTCASYGYDKRQLLSIAIDYSDIRYFREFVIPSIVDHDFPIHGDQLWQYFISLTQKLDYEQHLLDYLQNDGFFGQVSNLDHIKTVLQYISKKALTDEAFQQSEGVFIFTSCSNALILLKRSKLEDQELIRLTGDLLDLPNVKDILSQEAYVESLQAPYLVGYILQSYFTNNVESGITIQIAKYKRDFPSDYKELIKLIIELLTDKENGTSNIEALAEILGPKLTEDSLEYYENLTRYEEYFEVDLFNQCLEVC